MSSKKSLLKCEPLMAARTVWPTLTEKVWRREKSRSAARHPGEHRKGSRDRWRTRRADGLILLRQPRLSVQPVSEPHFRVLNDLYQQLQGGEGEEDANGGGGGGAGGAAASAASGSTATGRATRCLGMIAKAL